MRSPSHDTSRRRFLLSVGGGGLLSQLHARMATAAPETRIRPAGPGSKYVPRVKAAFVRRKGNYGMLWPGAIYDGETALKDYRRQIEATGESLEVPTEVASHNVGPNFAAEPRGMGLRFLEMDAETARKLEFLYHDALRARTEPGKGR